MNLRSGLTMKTNGGRRSSIFEVPLVPTTKEVFEIDLTYSPMPTVKTKTIISKTVPKTGKKEGQQPVPLMGQPCSGPHVGGQLPKQQISPEGDCMSESDVRRIEFYDLLILNIFRKVPKNLNLIR